jgi:hypothetical protein
MSRTTPEPDELDRELREAFRHAALPTAPLELRVQIESLPSSTQRVRGVAGGTRFGWRPRSSALLGLVAAVAVIAIVVAGLPFWLAQSPGSHESPSASQAMPTVSPRPSQSSRPEPTASDGSSITMGGPSISWTNVPLAPFGSNRVWAVAAAQVGDRIVVAANDSTQNDMKPVLIASVNGGSWARVPTNGAEFANVRLDYLLSIPSGLLLVGESLAIDPSCPAAAAGCNQAPAAVLMWRSKDGLIWQSLPASQTKPFDRVSIGSMAAGSAGLEAFGMYDPPTTKPVTPENVVLHSIDGVNWLTLKFPNQNGGSSGVLNQEVIATSSGFVAVGSGDQAAGNVGAAGSGAWYSADGLSWTRATTPVTGSTQGLRYAAAGARGVVATSYDPQGPNPLWVSADGATWQTAESSPYTVGASWLAGDAHEILVVSGPHVYWSDDGKTWNGGVSTPAMPSTGIVGTTSLAWIFGTTVLVVSPDDLSLYVGLVGV